MATTMANPNASDAGASVDPPSCRYETFHFPDAPRQVVGVRYRENEPTSPMPLGGLGTGSIYFTNRGTFEGNALTNCYRPQAGALEGSFFAVRTEQKGKVVKRKLCARSGVGPEGVAHLNFLGHWPIADLDFADPELPVEARLRALTPIIPGDSKASGTPAILFRLSVTNRAKETVKVETAFSWQHPRPEPQVGVRSSGNVDGFLTWKLGSLAPGKSARVPVVYALAPSRVAGAEALAMARSELAKDAAEPSLPKDGERTTGNPVWLRNEATDFAVDADGAFNWEDQRRQALSSPAGGCLSQHGFYLHYDGGHAGTRVMGDARLENLRVVEPTFISQGKAYTALETLDGKLRLLIRTRMGNGAWTVRDFVITNTGNASIQGLRLSVYANLEAHHDESNDRGELDPRLGSLVVTDSVIGDVCLLAGLEEPDEGLAGLWGSTINAMAENKGIARSEWEALLGKVEAEKVTATKTSSVLCLTREDPETHAGCTQALVLSPGITPGQCTDWDPTNKGEDFWKVFASRSGHQVSVGNTTALSASFQLGPQETREVRFVLAWYYPEARDSGGAFVGHAYSNWFSDSRAVAEYATREWNSLTRRTGQWQEKIYDAKSRFPYIDVEIGTKLPDWLKDLLVNCLYSWARNTAWIKDGRFTHSESFTGCPITETIVCRFYGSIPLALIFPDLEKNTMRQFIKHQRANGAIAFAFGSPEYWDKPFYETQQSLDSAEFALMAWRDAHWWDDDAWAREVYPAVKRALRFAQTLDLDGDGVINDEVSMQYYDCWKFTGISAYVGTVWLAALRAGEELAQRNGDPAFAAECRDWFARAQRTVEKNLWTGQYYRLYNDPRAGAKSDTSLGNQLVGQWYAYLCGLGEILPKDHILKALHYVAEHNGTSSPYGLVNGITSTGERDHTGSNGHSDSITIGETWCYASTCIEAGIPDLGLPFAQRLAENIALRQRHPWNTTWNMNPDTGEMAWGTEYYSNLCAWDLWRALTVRRDADGRPSRPMSFAHTTK